MLLCLIAHQLQCFPCRLLLRLFFAPAAALADDIAVEMNLHHKVLVVVGTALADEDVFEPLAGVLLHDLLQGRLVILDLFLLGIFDSGNDEVENML